MAGFVYHPLGVNLRGVVAFKRKSKILMTATIRRFVKMEMWD
jgi:hypothetical protein